MWKYRLERWHLNGHPPTEAYLDMRYSNNLLPVISKPTRLTYHSATLIIDHIYTKRQLFQKKQIKTKHKLYKTHFLSNNPIKVREYKKYANKQKCPKNAFVLNFPAHFEPFFK